MRIADLCKTEKKTSKTRSSKEEKNRLMKVNATLYLILIKIVDRIKNEYIFSSFHAFNAAKN